MSEKNYSNLCFILFDISIFVSNIVIFALDMTTLLAINDNASISLSQKAMGYPEDGIAGGYVFIDMIAFLVLFICLITRNESILQAHWFFTILIMIKEAVMFKLFTCYNYANTSIMIARSSLNFLFLMSSLIAQLISICDKRPNISDNLIRTFILIILILAAVASILAILILNIFILVRFNKPLEFVMNASNINIGYFNQTEIDDNINHFKMFS